MNVSGSCGTKKGKSGEKNRYSDKSTPLKANEETDKDKYNSTPIATGGTKPRVRTPSGHYITTPVKDIRDFFMSAQQSDSTPYVKGFKCATSLTKSVKDRKIVSPPEHASHSSGTYQTSQALNSKQYSENVEANESSRLPSLAPNNRNEPRC